MFDGHPGFVLKDRKVVPATDIVDWGRCMKDIQNRRVGLSSIAVPTRKTLNKKKKKIQFLCVSTVFLGLDHSFEPGFPEYFETMVFQNGSDVYMERCETWEQAEIMHKDICDKLRFFGAASFPYIV